MGLSWIHIIPQMGYMFGKCNRPLPPSIYSNNVRHHGQFIAECPNFWTEKNFKLESLKSVEVGVIKRNSSLNLKFPIISMELSPGYLAA
ncbi:MAG: hypothetical protein FGF51_00595 [Candidatus Brockarchaeota archaeon]|nr:hypothetical protein [Candidatus Brockarchaeota archaeon]